MPTSCGSRARLSHRNSVRAGWISRCSLLGPTGWGDELLAGLDLTLRLAVTSIVAGTALGPGLGARRNRPRCRCSAGCSKPSIWCCAASRSFSSSSSSITARRSLLAALLAPFGFAGFLEINRFWSGVLALALIHAAYASEVFRGALMAVPAGAIDAARAFGMSPFLVFRPDPPAARFPPRHAGPDQSA